MKAGFEQFHLSFNVLDNDKGELNRLTPVC